MSKPLIPLKPKPEMEQKGLEIYTVYDNPSDYPGKFVVRLHVAKEGKNYVAQEPLVVADTLEEARLAIPYGLACLHRHQDDDPVIVETWI